MSRAALAAIVLSLFAVTAVTGADAPAAPAKTTVVGVVSVTRNAEDVVTSVMITSKDAAYEVTMDEKGMKLGKLAGKEVEATGVVTEKDGMKWITVESFKEVEKPA